MRQIYQNINILKKQKGYTIAQLADKSGIAVGTLNKICSGATKSVTADQLRALASALGTHVDDLICGKIAPAKNNGFVRVSAQSVDTRVGDCMYNSSNIAQKVASLGKQQAKFALFSELAICGATAGDLLATSPLVELAERAVDTLLKQTANTNVTFVVGAPILHERKLFDAAIVCLAGKILGIVPKTRLSSLESRWFDSNYSCETAHYCGQNTPFGKVVFQNADGFAFSVAFESDLPYLFEQKGKVDAVLVLAATPHLVGATEKTLCALQNLSREIGVVAYCNAHYTESTTNNVYSAYSAIVERGKVIAQNKPFENKNCLTDIDVCTTTCALPNAVQFSQDLSCDSLLRKFSQTPFVPQKATEREGRCEEILTMQAFALKKRLEHTRSKTAVIGVSGGLDSTLALLVAKRAFELMARPMSDIVAVTMPCFGTTERTLSNSIALAQMVGATIKKIDISASVTQHLHDIGHNFAPDVTMENAQARERTQVLMDLANQTGGIVVGTGDLSEIALGWSTFNGDHISMYNPNCDVPKTLIPHLIKHEYKKFAPSDRAVLESIIDTPISPELIPTKQGEMVQKTEDIVGPYLLHDFFLHCFAKGYDSKKTLFVATNTFSQFDKQTILSNLKKFVSRFFTQQFKRNTATDGVQIGSVSLSYRNWQMPSDAVGSAYLDALDD